MTLRAMSIALFSLGLPPAALSAPAPSTLLPGQKLLPGQSITGGNGLFLMQPDGDLVVCAALEGGGGKSCDLASGPPLWASATAGNPGAYAIMEEIGVLAVYPSAACKEGVDCRLWQSHTMKSAGCNGSDLNCAFVEMQKDANVVMRKGSGPGAAGPTIWSTSTKQRPKNVKNVLWMIADDMRPDMKVAYGQQVRVLSPPWPFWATECLHAAELSHRGLFAARDHPSIRPPRQRRQRLHAGVLPDRCLCAQQELVHVWLAAGRDG